MDKTRRRFLRAGLATLGLGLAACTAHVPTPGPAKQASSPTPAPSPPAPTVPRALVVVQMAGGNDGLNTVIPVEEGLYRDLRPNLQAEAKDALPLDGKVALHSGLKELKAIFDQGHLAVIQGVGYPNPNRSHFRSMEIWQEATDADKTGRNGWLGRFLDVAAASEVKDNPFLAVNMGVYLPKALAAERVAAATLDAGLKSYQLEWDRQFPADRKNLEEAFADMYEGATHDPGYLSLVRRSGALSSEGIKTLQRVDGKYHSDVTYPQSPLATQLQGVARLLSAGVGTRVFHVQIGGFDTHSNQKGLHSQLMANLGDAIGAFYRDLQALRLADQVMLMTWSEFGRRVKENGNAGTDHGAAAPLFVVGSRVKGGVYGDHPSLSQLEDGDLRFTIDFRSVYATLLEDWLQAPAADVLGRKFDTLGFVVK